MHSFQSNELLTGIAILSVLRNTKKLEITKCLLIEPLIDIRIEDYLKKSNCKVRSIEELVVKKSIVFLDFNRRFQERLPLSINSLLLMSELKLLKIEKNNVIFTGEKFDFYEKTLGKTAHSIIAAASNLSEILTKEDASSLYLSLRIEL